MRVDPKLVKVVQERASVRLDPKSMIGTTRVDIKHLEQKTFEAAYKTEDKKFDIMIDEPAVRGGMSRGATPLGYFVTGAGGWLITQYTSLVMEKELPVENIRLMVRAHTIREKPRGFTDMIFEVRIDGGASPEQIQNLAAEASANCFVENTLAKAIPLTTVVFLNDEKTVTLKRNPNSAVKELGDKSLWKFSVFTYPKKVSWKALWNEFNSANAR